MTHDSLLSKQASSMARLMETSEDAGSLWSPEELGDILIHQLAAPLAQDLKSVGGGRGALEAASLSPPVPPIETFGDLFLHSSPPLELLQLVKRFAKSCRSGRESPLPDEIATILYFVTIVVARLRRGASISGLDDQSLRAGLEWTLAQPWLDEDTRGLLQEGLDSLPQ